MLDTTAFESFAGLFPGILPAQPTSLAIIGMGPKSLSIFHFGGLYIYIWNVQTPWNLSVISENGYINYHNYFPKTAPGKQGPRQNRV